MKTTNLLGLLILFILPFAFTACDDDDNAQIVTMRVSSTPVYYTPSFWASWPVEGMAVDEDGVIICCHWVSTKLQDLLMNEVMSICSA